MFTKIVVGVTVTAGPIDHGPLQYDQLPGIRATLPLPTKTGGGGGGGGGVTFKASQVVCTCQRPPATMKGFVPAAASATWPKTKAGGFWMIEQLSPAGYNAMAWTALVSALRVSVSTRSGTLVPSLQFNVIEVSPRADTGTTVPIASPAVIASARTMRLISPPDVCAHRHVPRLAPAPADRAPVWALQDAFQSERSRPGSQYPVKSQCPRRGGGAREKSGGAAGGRSPRATAGAAPRHP